MDHVLATSSVTVTSAVPMLLVTLQMYSPESWRPTLGSTKVWFTTLCLHGRGERSLDQVTFGDGKPGNGKWNNYRISTIYVLHYNTCLQRPYITCNIINVNKNTYNHLLPAF